MKKAFLFSGFFLLSGVLTGWWLFHDMHSQLNKPLNIKKAEILSIQPGMSLAAVVDELAETGWFDYPVYLRIEGRRKGVARAIKTGEYLIEPGATAIALLETLVKGEVMQHALTLLEGWTFKQIMAAIHASPFIRNTLSSTDAKFVMKEIGYPGYSSEGRFFPDTYHFPNGTTDVAFLRRAFDTMQTILQDAWDKRVFDLPYQSSYEALIMASIVEKETGAADERGKIAGVFVRRLRKNMKLQTDPTVIYALGDAYDGDIRRGDLSLDSPFNTYRHKGLPPTPIAAPGREAIHAALQPAPGGELYFVAMGNGRHYFSHTLEEHNKAVAEYQLGRK